MGIAFCTEDKDLKFFLKLIASEVKNPSFENHKSTRTQLYKGYTVDS